MYIYIMIGAAGVAAVGIAVTMLLLYLKKRKLDEADMWLVHEFQRCNVMVFGKKGSGKDVIFAHVIALRNEKHYSNIPYDGNTEIIRLDEIGAGDNTFEDCINGTITKFMPRFDEGCDIYVSDAGIYFPNTMDKQLNTFYPSMPVLFALARHLYQNNIHTNCQAFGRPWKKLREQADSYIQVLRTVRRGDYLYVKIVGYDKEKDAENEQNPSVKYTVRVPIAELEYDSRYFMNVFLLKPPTAREYVMQRIMRSLKYDRHHGKNE